MKQDGNKGASDLELDRKEKLSEFFQLFNFPFLWGLPLDYFRPDIAILKTIPFSYRMRLDLSKRVLFLQDSAANVK